MVRKADSNVQRLHRHKRIRGKISGSPEIPRLCVFRSLSHIYAQLIDDVNGVTIAAASSLDKGISTDVTKKEIAKEVGKLIAERAKACGIETVVFDRGGYIYHGRIQELAEGARENGLNF